MNQFTKLINDKHGYVMLAYLLEHGETKQHDFYGKICWNHDMIRRKLDMLESLDLTTSVMKECEGSRRMARFWRLTPRGTVLSERMALAEKALSGDFDLETGTAEETRIDDDASEEGRGSD